MTAAEHPACPVLEIDVPGTAGAPNPLLLSGADLVAIPAGGPPMRLARSWQQVRHITTSPRFAMAGTVPGPGGRSVLRGHPLTGAEMQSPDGGLLNMDGPAHRRMRHIINPLLRPAAVPAGHVAQAQQAAFSISGRHSRHGRADLATFAREYCGHLTCRVLGVPGSDDAVLARFGRMAFGAVHSRQQAATAWQVWQEEYQYWGWVCRHPGYPPGIARSVYQALTAAGHTDAQAVAAVGNIANGFAAAAPVLLACLLRIAAPPSGQWRRAVAAAIGAGAMFPIALPRIALDGATVDGRPAKPGTLWLPVLAAAARDGAPATAAFGPGPHRCPGAALAVDWITAFLTAVHTAMPGLRTEPPGTWLPGTLAQPVSVTGVW